MKKKQNCSPAAKKSAHQVTQQKWTNNVESILVVVVLLSLLVFAWFFAFTKELTRSRTPTPTAAPVASPVVEVASQAATLGGVVWQWQEAVLVDTANPSLLPLQADAFTLDFIDDKRVSVTTDCNNGVTTYTANESNISFQEGTATLQFCLDSQEAAYRNLLAAVTTYSVSGDKKVLVLTTDAGDQLFFLDQKIIPLN
jgi:heat shock protein HslJ